jgi:hypothetical protein
VDLRYPQPAENDVVVQVHAAGFTPGELDWQDTWTDCGVVVELVTAQLV